MTHWAELQFVNKAQYPDALYVMNEHLKIKMLNTLSFTKTTASWRVAGTWVWLCSRLWHNVSLRESILKTAKALVEDTKLLVAGAASSQEKLAQAAQSSAKTITQLTEVVKLGATSMGSEDPETQVRKK